MVDELYISINRVKLSSLSFFTDFVTLKDSIKSNVFSTLKKCVVSVLNKRNIRFTLRTKGYSLIIFFEKNSDFDIKVFVKDLLLVYTRIIPDDEMIEKIAIKINAEHKNVIVRTKL